MRVKSVKLNNNYSGNKYNNVLLINTKNGQQTLSLLSICLAPNRTYVPLK